VDVELIGADIDAVDQGGQKGTLSGSGQLCPALADFRGARDEPALRRQIVAKDGDQVALAADFDTQHAKAVLGVVEGHPVDEPGADLGWRARPGCLRHQGMMEIKIPLDQARAEGQAALATEKGLEGADAA
jgi:hypothetical protein